MPPAIERTDALADVEAGRPTAPSSASSSCGPTGGRRRGRTSSPPGGPASRSARPSSRWTPRPGWESGWWSTASPRRTSRPRRAVAADATSRPSVPRTPGMRVGAGYALLAPVKPPGSTRLTRPRAGRPRCSARVASRRLSPVRRPSLAVARARGLARGWPPTSRTDRGPARTSGGRRVDAPTGRARRALGRVAVGAGPRGAAQQVRALARAYVDRRVAGAEEPETEAGFLAVPSVARLVQLLDAP